MVKCIYVIRAAVRILHNLHHRRPFESSYTKSCSGCANADAGSARIAIGGNYEY